MIFYKVIKEQKKFFQIIKEILKIYFFVCLKTIIFLIRKIYYAKTLVPNSNALLTDSKLNIVDVFVN